jgi:hypothetical protein
MLSNTCTLVYISLQLETTLKALFATFLLLTLIHVVQVQNGAGSKWKESGGTVEYKTKMPFYVFLLTRKLHIRNVDFGFPRCGVM